MYPRFSEAVVVADCAGVVAAALVAGVLLVEGEVAGVAVVPLVAGRVVVVVVAPDAGRAVVVVVVV